MDRASSVNRRSDLDSVAAELDALTPVPDGVLLDLVTRDGSCMESYRADDEPEWSGDDLTDRDVAARICAGCPVRRECLELQLRTSGAATLGVWGALPAEDVRALFPVWQARRQPSGTAAGGERA
ncbi:MAG TPA: WhiB family transcriptional regulator [Pseudonocardiaceae bacterium]|nr:WhiB family transcriptional regulator [Pseudonocardiaceae bacterium]